MQVLVHRLGLIPILADPRMFNFKTSEDEESTEDNVIEFELKIKCTRNPNASKEATDPDDLYINHKGSILLLFFVDRFPVGFCPIIRTRNRNFSLLFSHHKTYELGSYWKPG